MRPVGAALFLLALTRLVAAGDSDAELGCGTGEDYGSYWIHWFAQASEEIFAERFAATESRPSFNRQ